MELLDAMRRWCDGADTIALRHLSPDVETEIKADGTPVTVADRAIEEHLREAIERDAPGSVIVGEEQGGDLPASGEAWILDPIDGTKNYARGIPVFATLIARWLDGELTHAIVSAPALKSRWWAADGQAFKDAAPIRVSGTSRLAEADLCTGGLGGDWVSSAQRPGLDRTLGNARRHRGMGDFWGHMLVAQGSMEAMIEYAPLALWDIAAPKCIVEAAGGRVSTHEGDDRLQPGAAVSSNGSIHEELLASLASKE